jgi:hypothetical protein
LAHFESHPSTGRPSLQTNHPRNRSKHLFNPTNKPIKQPPKHHHQQPDNPIKSNNQQPLSPPPQNKHYTNTKQEVYQDLTDFEEALLENPLSMFIKYTFLYLLAGKLDGRCVTLCFVLVGGIVV